MQGGSAEVPRGWTPFAQLGAYAELVWPAIAGAGLLAGYLLERAAEVSADGVAGGSAPLWLAYACYALAYGAGGWEATRDGLRQLRRGRLDIDFLMVVAAIGAALVGEFVEGALLLFLFALGHGLEHLALSRARSAVTALVVHAADGLDEISVGAPTTVAELREGVITHYEFEPASLGIARAPLSSLKVTVTVMAVPAG